MRPFLKTPFIILLMLFSFSTAAFGGEPRRGLYVSVIQDPPALSDSRAIRELVGYAVRTGIRDLFVQVYRANKAWFPSTIADSRPYEECLAAVGEDPFALLIEQAHASGVKVHAWLNLLSLSANTDAPLLKKHGTTILTRNRKGKNRLSDYKIDNQYFLEPGDMRVREAMSALVTELLARYPGMDGIQFDYIRYPDKDPAYGYTAQNMRRFKAATGCRDIVEGSQLWNDWKRQQVNELLEQLAKQARLIRPDIEVSATGCAPYVRAFHEAFQDWPSWLSGKIVDFVTVMSYTTDMGEFEKDIREVKINAPDQARVAMTVGAYEMLGAPDEFRRQLGVCETSGCRGCVIFHYGSLQTDPALLNDVE